MLQYVHEARLRSPAVDARWRHSPLTRSIESIDARLEHGRVHAGQPWQPGKDWFRFEQLEDASVAGGVIARIAKESEAPTEVAGTYAFRYAIHHPLMTAGYLVAKEGRVPVLRDNIALLNEEWLQQAAILAPRAIVLDGDELASAGCETVPDEDALSDALFAETARLIEPLIAAWSPKKLIARANAWGSALDALAYGFQFAGQHSIGLDRAWDKWRTAVRDRPFPVQRRPRRFEFDCDGDPDELLVRSGCCLWYTLPAAKADGDQDYCTSCYLQTDDRRRERMVAYRREQRAGLAEED